jgi:hypothetical protein
MALESVSWFRELLTGWNMIDGQGKRFLSNHQPKG